MQTTLRLLAADLHYPEDLQLHTSLSGRVGFLAARYLEIERSDGFRGIGEVRANITYLSKLPEDQVDPAIRDLCRRLPWAAAPEAIIAALDHKGPHIASAAVENALIEGIARAKGLSVAEHLGAAWRDAVPTNQCLFWGPDERFDRLTARFLAEGFHDIKVRIAVGPFEQDLARLQRLRERAGPKVKIAVDANGAWDADVALERLRALARFDLAYVEQPTRPGDWGAFERALRAVKMPLMLDESLADDGDIDRLAQLGPPALAHLKIVKLGGPGPLMRAFKRLDDAGIGVMVGQMNEGAMATALTAHCAMALKPRFAELYGCYGLLDDVAHGVTYANGNVVLPRGPGLGVAFEAARCRTVWVERFAT